MSIKFLSKNTIEEDHQRFAQHMKEQYNIENCELYEEVSQEQGEANANKVIEMGFKIEKDQVDYIVVMPFAENESGELGNLRNSWELRKEDGTKVENLPSLQEVFDEIGMKKK